MEKLLIINNEGIKQILKDVDILLKSKYFENDYLDIIYFKIDKDRLIYEITDRNILIKKIINNNNFVVLKNRNFYIKIDAIEKAKNEDKVFLWQDVCQYILVNNRNETIAKYPIQEFIYPDDNTIFGNFKAKYEVKFTYNDLLHLLRNAEYKDILLTDIRCNFSYKHISRKKLDRRGFIGVFSIAYLIKIVIAYSLENIRLIIDETSQSLRNEV